jgi:hypothetical protein
VSVASFGATATAPTADVAKTSAAAPRLKSATQAPPAAMSKPSAATKSAGSIAPKAADTSADVEPPLTIVGCVERDRDAFWLKDASGPNLPKSRSWKTGFLKKRSAAIALTDGTNKVGLQSYVGERVAATGTLVDGQLRTQSLQQLAESCSSS